LGIINKKALYLKKGCIFGKYPLPPNKVELFAISDQFLRHVLYFFLSKQYLDRRCVYQ